MIRISKNIFALKAKATRTTVSYQSVEYTNDSSNRELAVKTIKRNEINQSAYAAIDRYYDEPGKHKDLDFAGLFKGMASS